MHRYAVFFQEIDRSMGALTGGKGANLGELSQIEGIRVPRGFCVTTEAYKKVTENNRELDHLLDELMHLKMGDRDSIRTISAKIRLLMEGLPLLKDIEEEITGCLEKLDSEDAYAIRSSATAEDLPTASFAGQQDTYLNVLGNEAILKHISQCWASLFTERSIVYRLQNGFDHRKVQLAVVVQQMVFPQAAGILFTADPVTGNRKVLSIDASFGLGEALVSGLVNADNYKVKDGRIIDKKISAKKMAVYAVQKGGVKEQAIKPEKQRAPALTDEQIGELERIGRKIEAHFAGPQDIEWCLADDAFYIVQSRPITTLYPIPARTDQENRVYLSVGHNQMMTDAMKPLGLSFFLLTTSAPMHKAGGRLFVDVTAQLASPESSKKLIEMFGQSDHLVKDALVTITGKGFIKPSPEATAANPAYIEKELPWSYLEKFENNPAIVANLIRSSQEITDALEQTIKTKSGTELFDFIREHITQLKTTLFNPQCLEVIKIALYASFWLNEKMKEWVGETNAADMLSQSVPNNITSEMGLALLDVADVIRPYPEVVARLQRVGNENFLEELTRIAGGREARDAIDGYLHKYGMRCVGEIDITKARWSETPATLVPLLLSNIKNFEPGAGSRKFEKGRREALKKEQELLDRLKQLPGGEQKARETKRMIDLLRSFIGYREYPKYGMVSRYFVYKQALLKEVGRLLQVGVIRDKEDAFYLGFEELREVVRTHQLDQQLISERKAEYKIDEKLTPPRVMTSDGEIIVGEYKREHLPVGAIAGLAVSSGVIEGRARVILDMEDADMDEGDILITTFTDPSWTPLFVSIKGLVTEVGGLMTHGAVIAREYGLPAVVGVENATRLIKDGQRIRVNGTDGYVEIL